ncbi:MAG TPA: isochorismate synthase [Acidimicrobiales bacterium]|jgi:menaquinone-specific isochorismate synthase
MTNAPPPSAVRRRVSPGPTIDPYALAGNTGILYDSGDRLLVGIGSALTLPLEDGLDAPSGLERIRRVLAAIPCDDEDGETGSAVMAFGALPFDRSEPTSLVVPELIYERRSNGEEWVTVVGRAFAGDPGDELAAARHDPSASTADRLSESLNREEDTAGAVVRPLSSDHEFLNIVAEAVASIERGELTKVVLARQVDVDLEQPIEVPELLDRWRAMEPNCTVFSMPTPEGQFVGASPELLVERHGDQVHCRPLAGSTGRMSDQDGADFRSSTKETLEHRLVAEAIGKALAPLCSSLDLPAEPTLVRLHNIMHLGTSIHGVLLRRPTADHPDGEVPTALDLVSALHPTPAVGGVPTDRAVDTIGKLESELRGTYAGPVGFVDGNGDGRWVVGIRAATLNGSTARLVAGVGIVHGSEPAAELAETSLKFTAVFDALAPGVPFTTAPRQLPLPAIP